MNEAMKSFCCALRDAIMQMFNCEMLLATCLLGFLCLVSGLLQRVLQKQRNA